jgi:hypothetical protein
MGFVRHHAIVVTSWNKYDDEKEPTEAAFYQKDQHFTRAVAKAEELGCRVQFQTRDAFNAYRTMIVCPDGSKSGWNEDQEGNTRRRLFKEWLREQRYADQSSPYEWCEIVYGSDDAAAFVVDSRWGASIPNDITELTALRKKFGEMKEDR